MVILHIFVIFIIFTHLTTLLIFYFVLAITEKSKYIFFKLISISVSSLNELSCFGGGLVGWLVFVTRPPQTQNSEYIKVTAGTSLSMQAADSPTNHLLSI